MKKQKLLSLLLAAALALSLSGCEAAVPFGNTGAVSRNAWDDFSELPVYENEPAAEINGDVPPFTKDEIKSAENAAKDEAPYVDYKALDGLGRTAGAYALLGAGMLPDDDSRDDGDALASVKPSGWVQAKYGWIDNGGWLYNRCHLVAWSLGGASEKENLVTGTRYFNTGGMLPYEIRVLEYLDENPGNHVMYRATPMYSGNELLARGLVLEARSVEDGGALSFCAYIHNVQPGVDIDYATGESRAGERGDAR